MKKIKSFSAYNEGFGKITTYLDSLIKKGGKLAADVWNVAKRESEETKIAIGILKRLVIGETVSDAEKIFLKAQSKDLIKILPLIAIQGIPIPVPITPLLVILGKKYGFDFLPKDNRWILELTIELTDEIKNQLVDIPETGPGFHILDLELKDGTILKNRTILNRTNLVLNFENEIQTGEIENIFAMVD